jgi:hypothetical protein
VASRSVVLIGGPDSGKTNYLGRLWPSFHKKKGELRAERVPDDIRYVEGATEHLMKGKFAPRSDRNLEIGRADFSIEVRAGQGTGELRTLMVPDISGELWTRAVATSEISVDWMSVLKGAEGAILFLRHGSDQTVQPLDWVTARSVLNLFTEEETDPDAVEDPSPAPPDSAPTDDEASEEDTEQSEPHIPTQVLLCELYRYLELLLADRADSGAPRVAVVIAAWDLVDAETNMAGPMKYLERQFPLFAGRLECGSRLDVKVFGLSVVGGDLDDDAEFKERFLHRLVSEQGYVIVQEPDGISVVDDVTLPIAWAVGN